MSTPEHGEFLRRDGGRITGTRMVKAIKRAQHTEATKYSSKQFTENEQNFKEPAWIHTRFFAHMLWLLAWWVLWKS